MKIKKQTPSSKRKIVTSAIIAALLVFVAYGVVAYASGLYPFKPLSERGWDESGVNQKKTDQEKSDTDTLVSDPEKKTNRPNTDIPKSPEIDESTGVQAVNVMITSVNQTIDKSKIEASGFVTNSVESEGVCSFSFVHADGTEIIKTTTAMPNPTSTTCKTLHIPSSEFKKGSWDAYLTYSSKISNGSAEPMGFIVE